MKPEATLLVEFRAQGKRAQRQELYRVVQKGDELILEMLELDALGVPIWIRSPIKGLIESFEWSTRWASAWAGCATRISHRCAILDTSKSTPALPSWYHGIVECSSSRNDRAPDDEDQDVWVAQETRSPDFVTKIFHLVKAEDPRAIDIAFGALIILALYEASNGA